MRIAYFLHVNGGSRSGVFHKVHGQVAEWCAHGHHVRVFVATRDEVSPWRTRFDDALVCRYDTPSSRMRAMTALVAGVRRFAPSILYQRWDLFYPQMLFAPRDSPLIVEINSDDLSEYALGSRMRSSYNAYTRSLVLRRARALVFVTSELSGSPAFRRLGGRRVVIPNGIELEAYPQLPAPSHERPRLVFVGTAAQPWQGVDKLVALAVAHPDWDFDVVGTEETGTASPANVVWHGPLDRAGVVDVLASADVGIGTLALHRKSMDEASSLKVREYLAVGLPVINGCIDTDADSLGPYVLRLPNTEANVVGHLTLIEDFVMRSRGVRVPRTSVAHIGVAAKEERRLALFHDVLGV